MGELKRKWEMPWNLVPHLSKMGRYPKRKEFFFLTELDSNCSKLGSLAIRVELKLEFSRTELKYLDILLNSGKVIFELVQEEDDVCVEVLWKDEAEKGIHMDGGLQSSFVARTYRLSNHCECC